MSTTSGAFGTGSIAQAYRRFVAPQLFEPWAREFVRRAAPPPGGVVLDVATGTGAVARALATAVGPAGRVVASDVSGAMILEARTVAADPAGAPIEYQEWPASALGCGDDSFAMVFCQQGLQFVPQRDLALSEMRRSLVTGGVIQLAVWARERPYGLYGPINETMRDVGIPEPFPGAYDRASYTMDAGSLAAALCDAGFDEVKVETVELTGVWRPADAAVSVATATPFGPALAAASPRQRDEVHMKIRDRLGISNGAELAVTTYSHLGRGVKPLTPIRN
jgi:ubiquinone/menaquinone biosynthesis C-methylase UbiE